jgi:hypothetical protein
MVAGSTCTCGGRYEGPSVSSQQFARAKAEGQLHRVRARAALTAFTNALAVSLFALIPGHKIGPVSAVVAVVGLVFVAASLLSLIRLRPLRWGTLRDARAAGARPLSSEVGSGRL